MKRFLPLIITIIIIIALTLSGMSFLSSFKNEKSTINQLGIEFKDIGRFLTAQLFGYSRSVNTNIVTQNNNQIDSSVPLSTASNVPISSKNKPLITYNYDYVPPIVKKTAVQSGSYTPQTNTQALPKPTVSPYFGKIKFYNVENKANLSSTLISLSAYFYNESKIDITGWSIESTQGSFSIPQGMEKYNPYNSFTKNIFIKTGDRVYLSSSQNPLGKDSNFRLNKCLGYMKNYKTFPIYFYENCPKPENYEIISLNSSCQKYVLGLRTCEIPDYGKNFVISADSQCTSYINDNFNYSGCFNKHADDDDFLQNEWHIYMNQNLINRTVDTLILRDKSGLLVDKYTYRIY